MSDKKFMPCKEDLEYLYNVQGFTQTEIGDMYGYEHKSIGSFLNKYEISLRSKSESSLIRYARSGKLPLYKEDLEYLYSVQGFTLGEIGVMYDYSATQIGKLLRKYDIHVRSTSESQLVKSARFGKVAPSKEDLDYLYSVQGFYKSEIGEMYGYSSTQIGNYLKKYDIPFRTYSESQLVILARIGIIPPSKEDLDYLYSVQGFSRQDIGDMYGISRLHIRILLEMYDIHVRNGKEAIQYHIKNKDIYNSKNLMKAYLEQFKDDNGRYPFISELAEFFNIYNGTIRLKIHEYKLEDNTQIYSNHSEFQTILEDWLNTHDIPFSNEFYLPGYRYDIKIEIEGINVLIEANPGSTHAINPNNTIFNSTGNDVMYHKNKTDLAVKHGYRLIHIYDWFIDDLDNILAFLLPHRKFHGRETVYEHDVPVKAFIKKYHRQHTCSKNNGSILKDKKTGEILAAMVFRKFTVPKTSIVEMHLEKYCVKPGVLVRGGFSKLIKNWVKTEGYEGTIVTYCDLDINSSLGYQKIGFKPVRWTRNYYYCNNKGEYVWRRTVQKKNIPKLFPDAKGKTEREMMASVGYFPVYTAGITRLELKV